LAISKEKAYYKAISRAVAAVNDDLPLKDTLKIVVRNIAVAMKARVSILTFDPENERLFHRSTWGLPHAYLHKGLLNAGASLGEVYAREPVVIIDVGRDKRVQYPKQAIEAGIRSLVGVPIKMGEVLLGSLRVYTKEPYEFSNRDIKFLKTMAELSGITLYTESLSWSDKRQKMKYDSEETIAGLQQSNMVNFAHPSEKEFARILDFYHIDWVYEPRSFALNWQDGKVIEMFTPDFYLPKLDLYVELTTLRQKLVTEKNRKLKRLRQLYPDVNITLLYKKDFDRLLAKYGHGPLAQTRAHGVSSVLYSAPHIKQMVKSLAKHISTDYREKRPVMVGIQRGFLCFMADLMRQITVPIDIDFMAISHYGGDESVIKITKDLDLNITGRHVLIVEDIVDTGMTLSYLLEHLNAKGPASIKVCTLFDRPARRIANINLDYVGFQVPDEFIVGYGLDYQEEYRNLPFVGIINLGKEIQQDHQTDMNTKKCPE
jgi:hypoxanthine phosphoribosyltransferase